MCYFSNGFNCTQESVDAICHTLNGPKFGRVDFIVGTGVSGTILLAPVSLLSGIRYGVIRKQLEVESSPSDGGSHSLSKIELYPYNLQVNRYVVIDDMIESGQTMDRVILVMGRRFPHAECVGIILYQDYGRTHHLKHHVISLGNDIHSLVRMKEVA